MDFDKNDFLSNDWQSNQDVDRDSEGFKIDNRYESFPHTKEGSRHEFSVEDMTRFSQDVFLYNKVALYQALKQVYLELNGPE